MNKKKLLVLTSTFPRWPNDSVPPFVFELCKKLQSNFDITVLAPHYPGAAKKEIWQNISIIRFSYFFSPLEKLAVGDGIISTLKKNILYYLLIPFFIIAEFIAIKKTIKKLNPDIIHAHWIIPQGLLIALAKSDKPFIITTHGGDIWTFRNSFMMALKKFTLKQAKAVTVVSQAIKDDIEKNLLTNLKISVISMGVDMLNFSAKKASPELRSKYKNYDNIILFVGRLVEKKGIEYLLQAMPNILLEKPKSILIIIGSGPCKNELEKIISKLNIQSNVILLGPLANDHLPKYYASADVFVAPSIEAIGGDKEGLPVTIMEAMSSETIVVASDLKGNKDIIENEINAFLCKQKNVDDLAKKIVNALNIKSNNNIRIAARQTIEKKFAWTVIGQKYTNLLNEIYETHK